MFITDGVNIRIPRGDTASVPFIFYKEIEGEETPYIIPEGQYAEISVSIVKGSENVLVKTAGRSVQHDNGTVVVRFSPEDTDMGRGKYVYTVRLLKEDGSRVDTWLGGETAAVFEII